MKGRADGRRPFPTRLTSAARRDEPDHDALIDWACRTALERLAIASPREIARFFGLVTIAEARDWGERNLGRAAGSAIVESANGAPPRGVSRGRNYDAITELVAEPGGEEQGPDHRAAPVAGHRS